MARGSHDAGPTDPTGGMSMMEPFEAVKHAQVKIAQLSADNAALRREAHTLRTQLRETRESHSVDEARERAAETASRTDALRHLAAAEDHVALLLSESKGRLRQKPLSVNSATAPMRCLQGYSWQQWRLKRAS